MFSEASDGSPVLAVSASDENPIDHTPTLSLAHIGSSGTEPASSDIKTFFAELRVVLSRYRTMRLVDDMKADYHLKIDIGNLGASSSRLFIELEDARDQSILLARGYDMDPARRAEACLAHLLERDPNDARTWGL